MIRLVGPLPAPSGPDYMYGSIGDFLRALSDDSPWLWGVFVLAVMASLSLGLYTLWEVVLRLVSRLGRMVIRSRRMNTDSGRS